MAIDRIVVLSNDTDVFVLLCYFGGILNRNGLSELWFKTGVADTTRFIPIHTLAGQNGELCSVLPALHALTGSDCTRKVGPKAAAVKSNPLQYLKEFGLNMPDIDGIYAMADRAEAYLVQVMKKGNIV